MAKKSMELLTETMFYVLMAFLKEERCGVDAAEYIRQKTHDRIQLGPGTLYTILAKFQEEGLLRETSVHGRKRTYRITDRGRQVYLEEVERLRRCLLDAEEENDSSQKEESL